ncbi:hypothetical protein E2C01_082483 [Portunus trituberculatus]|uniref:Uncharacterized protein n=1 Tax=Portunus trituberculatus TaxID=210409 RepID=A0A5B7IYL7_PORTR|nr:hypothetical protein [Portunus trituberculatus]
MPSFALPSTFSASLYTAVLLPGSPFLLLPAAINFAKPAQGVGRVHDPRPMGQLGYVEVETQCAEQKTSQGVGNGYRRCEEQTTSHERDYGGYLSCSRSEKPQREISMSTLIAW